MSKKLIIVIILIVILLVGVILYYIEEVLKVTVNFFVIFVSVKLTLLHYESLKKLDVVKIESEKIWNFLEEIGMDSEEVKKAKEVYYND